MPITVSCHFWEGKWLQVTSMTHASSAIVKYHIELHLYLAPFHVTSYSPQSGHSFVWKKIQQFKKNFVEPEVALSREIYVLLCTYAVLSIGEEEEECVLIDAASLLPHNSSSDPQLLSTDPPTQPVDVVSRPQLSEAALRGSPSHGSRMLAARRGQQSFHGSCCHCEKWCCSCISHLSCYSSRDGEEEVPGNQAGYDARAARSRDPHNEPEGATAEEETCERRVQNNLGVNAVSYSRQSWVWLMTLATTTS